MVVFPLTAIGRLEHFKVVQCACIGVEKPAFLLLALCFVSILVGCSIGARLHVKFGFGFFVGRGPVNQTGFFFDQPFMKGHTCFLCVDS